MFLMNECAKLRWSNLVGAFMLVVPGVLVMGPVVLLAVAPHADLHLLFLIPAIAHGHLLTTPRLHGLGTWSCKGGRGRGRNWSSRSAYSFNIIILFRCRFLLNIHVQCVHLPDLCWLPHPDPVSLVPLLGSSQLELVSMGFPQADVPLSTVTGGGGVGSPHVEDSFCLG